MNIFLYLISAYFYLNFSIYYMNHSDVLCLRTSLLAQMREISRK